MFIVEQGEAADSLYLILSGEVEVAQDAPDGTRTVIRRQGPGEFFGELGVARHEARSANVIAVEAVTCLVFSRRAGQHVGRPGRRLASCRAWSTSAVTRPVPAAPADHGHRRAGGRRPQGRRRWPPTGRSTRSSPTMFPRWLLEEMMGQEWFVRVQPAPQLETGLFGD